MGEQKGPSKCALQVPRLQLLPPGEKLARRMEGLCRGGPSNETPSGDHPPSSPGRGAPHCESFETDGGREPDQHQEDHGGRCRSTPLMSARRGVFHLRVHRRDRWHSRHQVATSTYPVARRRHRGFRLPLPDRELGGPPAQKLVGDDHRDLRLLDQVLELREKKRYK